MAKTGTSTREKILDATEALIYDHGFGATSIDRVIAKAGLTKGGFFYHFKNKNELARALVDRYAERDRHVLDTFMARAEKLSRDPLQQLLIFVGLIEEMADDLNRPFPGCLFATFCYENALMDEPVLEVCANSFLAWRYRIAEKIREILNKHPAKRDFDPDGVADFFHVVFEGAIIFSKTFQDPRAVSTHFKHYRNYLELLFGVEA